MGLVVPSHSDYDSVAESLANFFRDHDLDYCIYGSFLFPEKLKPGLSDIDAMVVSKVKNILFPISVTRSFGRVKERISQLGIPIQINWVTRGQFARKFLSPDANYLEEVSRGLGKEYASVNFKESLFGLNLRDPQIDDAHMARYFLRKIIDFPTDYTQIESILSKSPSDITREDQKRLWSFWDGFKKMISFLALTLRIRDRVSYFSRPNGDIVKIFQETNNLEGINIEEYLKSIDGIKNIGDWYEYLKNGGLNNIELFYTTVFTPFVESVEDE